jgi:uncharacterized protein
MPDAKAPPDLSMEEILATIRRLIAAEDAAGAARRHDPQAAGAGDADAVLELTEAIDETGAVRRLAPAVAPVERLAVLDAPPLAATPGAAVRREPRLDAPPPLDARALEEVVHDLLRPMLRTWVDAHLPALVERLVRAEIARAGNEVGSR